MAKEEATLLIKVKQKGSKIFGSISSGIGSVAKASAVAATAITGFLAGTIVAYRGQEEAVNSLNQSLLNQGIFTDELSKKYQNMASSLQQVTLFGDEAIIAAQAQLQSYLGQIEVTEDLTKAILDFATAQKIDIKSAADLVGKSIGSSTNALGRYGVQIDSTATASEKMALVTEALNTKFGGQAEAAAKGLGRLVQLKNAFGDLLEVIGERFAPAVGNIAEKLTDFVVQLQQNRTALQGVETLVRFTMNSFVGLANIVVSVGQTIGQVLGTTVGAITQLMEGNFRQAWTSIKEGFGETAESVKEKNNELLSDLDAQNKAAIETRNQDRVAELEQIAQAKALEREIEAEDAQIKAEEDAIRKQEELEREALFREAMKNARLQAQMNEINQQILNEQNREKKLKLIEDKRLLREKAIDKERRRRDTAFFQFKKFLNSQEVAAAQNTASNLSRLQQSESKKLFAIGKAAALATIAIDTAKGATAAYASLAPIPIVGPTLGIAAAAALVAFGLEQARKVGSQQMGGGTALAEGGIVRATPGGIQATIGEGGQDEAVIPLEDGENIGTTINITVFGGMLGTDDQAREFAVVMDRELVKLRQNNESIAFESGLA